MTPLLPETPDAAAVAMLHDALSGSAAANALMSWVSMKAAFAFPLLAILCGVLCLRHRRDGLITFAVLLCLLGSADLLGNGLKHVFVLPRPCFDLKGVLTWIPDKCGGARRGMPSNHAINFFTVSAFVLFALRRRWPGIVLLALSCLVGVSRIYLGRHYPSQVFAGAAIGLTWGALGAFVFSRFAVGKRMCDTAPPSAGGPVPAPSSPTGTGSSSSGSSSLTKDPT